MRLDDTPAGMIARLDAALGRRGQGITLKRMSGAGQARTSVDVDCRAFVRDFDPSELINGMVQGTSEVVISPSEIIVAAWESGRPAGQDANVPMAGNMVTIRGKDRRVMAAEPFYANDTLVRIRMAVEG
ncbi:hypothetical protein [Azorhizobium doebereinerae]|uniref:hypothetical protein n=1 Tax=Azorhizobium doebereinerae TaxID=281091 RepID=UPI00048E7365|nr:hypothetical protein [Azorhizobium doebereinerae]